MCARHPVVQAPTAWEAQAAPTRHHPRPAPRSTLSVSSSPSTPQSSVWLLARQHTWMPAAVSAGTLPRAAAKKGLL